MKTSALLPLILVLTLMIAGCSGNSGPSPAPNGTSPNAPAAPAENGSLSQNQTGPAPTCDDFCAGKPHGSCAGSWNASGVYPSCACVYVCAPPPAANSTNSTPPVMPAAPPSTPLTNITIAQLLDDSMKAMINAFYLKNNGVFQQNTYTWIRIPAQTQVGEISFNAAPGTDVKFNNQSTDTIVASAFTVFLNTNLNLTQTYGLAIFKANQTILDPYVSSGMFSIDYFPSVINKRLQDCTIYERDYYTTEEGDQLVSYKFACWEVYDKA